MGGEKCKSPIMDFVQWNHLFWEVRFFDEMWELLQIKILQMNFDNVGTTANQDFADEL